ncbi:hypothetical protein Q3V30_12190 [Erwinia pyri]|uniref:Uncharacterized protein n=1 Tax=Erwinia pyri TaxID=3062598 RepID=A0AA50DJP0_9GAMM|nr:hypothetical protein [Erwinia sp. DE2]WLS77250.1 hypothetical protein Q3V30_12190 [Erwinia sp. DE2]
MIMKLTEHEMRGVITGKALPADIRFGESVPAYLVRKFDEFQEQVKALPAENEELKYVIAQLLQDAQRIQQLEPNAGTEARISTAKNALRAAPDAEEGV